MNEKIFALTNIDEFLFFNVKCKPEQAIVTERRIQRSKPGLSHEQKTLEFNINIREHRILKDLKKWIKDSFNLVSKKKLIAQTTNPASSL